MCIQQAKRLHRGKCFPSASDHSFLTIATDQLSYTLFKKRSLLPFLLPPFRSTPPDDTTDCLSYSLRFQKGLPSYLRDFILHSTSTPSRSICAWNLRSPFGDHELWEYQIGRKLRGHSRMSHRMNNTSIHSKPNHLWITRCPHPSSAFTSPTHEQPLLWLF